jgi:hypothetical protein
LFPWSSTRIRARYLPAAGGSPFSCCPFSSSAGVVHFFCSVPPKVVHPTRTGFCTSRAPSLGFLFCWVRDFGSFHNFLRPVIGGSCCAGQPQESFPIHFLACAVQFLLRQNLAAGPKPEPFPTCSRGAGPIFLELIPCRSWISFAAGFSHAWSTCGSRPSSDFHS